MPCCKTCKLLISPPISHGTILNDPQVVAMWDLPDVKIMWTENYFLIIIIKRFLK